MISSFNQILNKYTRPLRRSLKRTWRKILMLYFPKKYASILFREELGYDIDWNNPKDLNEKINWLAFNTDTTEWTRLTDKYRVREFVKERGCEEILIPLLGVWNSVEEIDWDKLPNEFVIKTNCGSGDVIFVEKNNIELDSVIRSLQNALKERFGLKTAEPHYLRINPLIIAENLLKSGNGEISDYKIWCFNGEPYCIFTCTNRDISTHTVNFNYFDLLWHRHDEYMSPKYRNDAKVEQPQNILKMLEYASILSQGFPQVRVDLYEVDGSIYFGEMTFTSMMGRMTYLTQQALLQMGQQIILPNI